MLTEEYENEIRNEPVPEETREPDAAPGADPFPADPEPAESVPETVPAEEPEGKPEEEPAARSERTFEPEPEPAPVRDPGPEKKADSPKKKHPALRMIAATLALAILFGVVAGGIIYLMNRGAAVPAPQQGQEEQQGGREKPEGSGSADSEPSSVELNNGEIRSAADVIAEALAKLEETQEGILTVPQIAVIMQPAMVSVSCTGTKEVSSIWGTQEYQYSSAGSGIIVGTNETELLIVTNNHVISGADSITVQFANGEDNQAYVKGASEANDLAVIVVRLEEIKAETKAAIACAELGDSDALSIGESVVAVGNALGRGQSVTLGIVSALNRSVTDENGNTALLIQTDAAINPGNSGGALVNLRGQVIGINSAKYADEAVEGMGFAIPINTALPILEDLMSRTTRIAVTDPEKMAYLGITVYDISASAQQAYGMPAGVYVNSVAEGFAAEAAGLQKGDVITAFEGETVTSRASLSKILSYYEAGETVTITVQRPQVAGEYQKVEIQLTLSKRPNTESETAPSPGKGRRGSGETGF